MNKTVILIATTAALLGFMSGAKTTYAADSVYTDLNLDACETLAEDPMGVSLRCKGYKDLPVYFKEGDLRQSVQFGIVDRALVDGAFESFSAFNHVNTKIEWRLGDNDQPVAAILRWFIDNPGPDGGSSTATRGEILVVSKVARENDGGSCFVALIDAKANPNANDLARQTADESAAKFACGMEEPEWVGSKGDLISERTFSWPEGYVVE
ncbi:hypothetical protein [Rhizobium sp. AAP43]|uniref:hypothetical protein n=1 Tax=Rhizobium sp. AAP43 TaxID=1523420 RepID=UPI0006B89C8C|nr:hypothetical protein [Rhizobium sp. AAP43]